MVEGVHMGYMAQKTDATDDQPKTIELAVAPETVIRGLELNSKPGTSRSIVFQHSAHGGYGEGVLRDVSGIRWDGEAPPVLQPRAFIEDADYVGLDVGEARRIAREEAEKEGEADPDAWADEAAEEWRDQMRALLKDEIVVEGRFPEETDTVYHIEYVEDDE